MNSTYAYRTVWVDENQDKSHWYPNDKNSLVIDGIWVSVIPWYNYIKEFIVNNTSDDNELVEKTRKNIYKMISDAEKIIEEYREYINRTISEAVLVDNIRKYIIDIRKLYIEQGDFPFASNELHEWQSECTQLAGIIYDFTLCYDDKAIKNRDSKNRYLLFESTLKRYNESLERLRTIELDLAFLNTNEGDSNE